MSLTDINFLETIIMIEVLASYCYAHFIGQKMNYDNGDLDDKIADILKNNQSLKKLSVNDAITILNDYGYNNCISHRMYVAMNSYISNELSDEETVSMIKDNLSSFADIYGSMKVQIVELETKDGKTHTTISNNFFATKGDVGYIGTVSPKTKCKVYTVKLVDISEFEKYYKKFDECFIKSLEK